MKTVRIKGREVGAGHPCFVILEVGVNYKDMAEARRVVDAGVEIGADAVKFQTFHAKTIAMKGAILFDGRGKVDQYAEAAASEDRLTDEFQTEIIRYAQSKGVAVFSTPSHPKDVDLLERIGGLDAYKLGSDDLTNLPLLRYTASRGKPMFISSGVSTLAQIDEAIATIRAAGNDQILLFHCVSQYPAQPKDMNLRTIETLRRAFDIPIGLSDHTLNTHVAVGASALGIDMLEKHFTLSRTEPGPDNFFSMEPGPMKAIIDGIREVEAALGVGQKAVRPVEREMIKNFHKSVFAMRDLPAGRPVSAEDVDVLRPLIGIPAKDYDLVIGMAPTRPVKAGEALQWDHFKAVAPVGAAR